MSDDRRHDVLLLDFGGVCLLNPVELHRHTETRLQLPQNSLTWMGPVDPATDELWQQMTSGHGLTERQYWATRAGEVGRTVGREMTVRDYMQLIYEPPRPELIRPGAVAVVGAARSAGFGVSVLTNDMRAFHGPDWEHGIEFLRQVDHIVDCSDTGVLKPDRRAFDRALGIVGASADRVLFVDDLNHNVDGASQAGLDGFWFDVANPESSWRAVGERLGLDPVA